MATTIQIDRPRSRVEIEERIGKAVARCIAAGGGELEIVLTEVDDREDDVLAHLGFAPGHDLWTLRCALPARASSNISIRRLNRDDARVVGRLLELVPGWRFDDHGRRAGEEAVRPEQVLAYTREGKVAAFAVRRLVDMTAGTGRAYLLGFGVLPEFDNVARAAAASLLHGVLRHLGENGATEALAEVPPGAIEAVNVLEMVGFRYASATRRYHRTVF